jgi:hypothetical protein
MAMGMGVWMERPRTLMSGYRAKMLMGWGNEGEKRVVGGATRGSVASGRCLHSRPSLETSPSPNRFPFMAAGVYSGPIGQILADPARREMHVNIRSRLSCGQSSGDEYLAVSRKSGHKAARTELGEDSLA